MSEMSRRTFMVAGSALTGALSTTLMPRASMAANTNGFMAAASDNKTRTPKGPGLQRIYALCEVTGGGEKVYGIAAEYDADIDPHSLDKGTFKAAVIPAAEGFFAGMPNEPDKNATQAAPVTRTISAIYTNTQPTLMDKSSSVTGRFVIVEFHHNPDLSLPTTDSDKVSLTQMKSVKTLQGKSYAASHIAWSNVEGNRNNTIIRGVDDWEQSHWWWDDTRSAWLEYSIFLPKSFLKPGGENRSYPLLLAITHSGTSYDGTCSQTLTEQCIASIWSQPEEQEKRECVVITPRYERTTMNDYWEHTSDVENTWRLVQSLLSNTWNYGNPNLDDRRDKVLKIDASRVYCTGWSMGAMTSLWLMAKHPDTFAAGLIIAGQQRPNDLVTLAQQKVLIITGSDDTKSTPWNEKCVPVWEQSGAKVIRPTEMLDPDLIFPISQQQTLNSQVKNYLAEGGNITFLTFKGVDHMASARKFFYIESAREWLFRQSKA
ncbi:prolyl oligopeptidase family serine peptidase [Rosenbergiella metrosideri]|uniref:prolyl oligopeptidase family serine peptidase n=1 Tax=Rosenbergiella metrosideri TaxID=2921185 RepID=UPI001F4FDF51|nr:prolyl oligopeptidase family serine peptidase [Rosenbergiella metrosideri]